MRNLEEILRLMEIKRQLLRGIEDATQEMLACRREELPEQVKERQRFIDELERQDAINTLQRLNGTAAFAAGVCFGRRSILDMEFIAPIALGGMTLAV